MAPAGLSLFITIIGNHAMASKLGHGKITDGHNDPRSLKGVERRRQLREQNTIEVERITAELVAGLGRPAIGGETVAAEVIAATLVQAKRLREAGKDDRAERHLLHRLLLTTPFGVMPAPPAQINTVSPGAYFVATKGDDLVADEATATDEVKK
jgi:hypothetical protein